MFDAAGRKPVDEAQAGDIVVFSGVPDFNIGDTLVSIDGGAVKQGAALKSLLDPAKLLV